MAPPFIEEEHCEILPPDIIKFPESTKIHAPFVSEVPLLTVELIKVSVESKLTSRQELPIGVLQPSITEFYDSIGFVFKKKKRRRRRKKGRKWKKKSNRKIRTWIRASTKVPMNMKAPLEFEEIELDT